MSWFTVICCFCCNINYYNSNSWITTRTVLILKKSGIVIWLKLSHQWYAEPLRATWKLIEASCVLHTAYNVPFKSLWSEWQPFQYIFKAPRDKRSPWKCVNCDEHQWVFQSVSCIISIQLKDYTEARKCCLKDSTMDKTQMKRGIVECWKKKWGNFFLLLWKDRCTCYTPIPLLV